MKEDWLMASNQPVPETLIALDSLMSAARIFAGITAESIAQTGDAVTLPQLRVLVLASTRSDPGPGAARYDSRSRRPPTLRSERRSCSY
jgi:hypothetical protein